jgi:hypothetical protein
MNNMDFDHLTSRDLANATGFDERYINKKLDDANIDLTTVQRIEDGRIIAQTRGGQYRILYGIDSGPRGRSLYFGTYSGVTRLILNRSDYPEIEKNGADIYFPEIEVY